ncbi:hypothetical protein DM02DRAFT_308604 [Periconia macrospinosa]|uniref:Rhodopsin domain-containing protein n=1 Tax=Periconia macrospinosa TaxID=97972 RepID=A0A2V1DVI5_9PLEO|nr:hypothetical protein DM02DRAFT_308604 [Periconia macrospinosa]
MASHEIPNRGPELLAVNYSFVITALIAYSLRVYVRVGMVKAFGTDDWLMGLALMFFIAYDVSSNTGVHYGTGRHHADLSNDQILQARRCWYFCYLFYSSAMICSKFSIGTFLLRIAVRKVHTYIIWGAMAISVVSGAAFFFVTLFQCNPISYFWTKHLPESEGTCINMTIVIALAYLYSAFSIISDFTFALLPALLVMNLQLARKTKIALIPLLTMGCIASSAVVARLPYMLNIANPDFLWATSDIAIWSTVEQGLAITAGSLATIRPLFSIFLFKIGLTSYPTKQQTPVFGGSTTANRIVGGHRANAPSSQIDMYRLPSRGPQEGDEESGAYTGRGSQDIPRSPTWYQTQFEKVKRGSLARGKPGVPLPPTSTTLSGDGSEESLRGLNEKSSKSREPSMDEERGMQIMVSRSFFVTDAERASYVQENEK